MDDMTPADGGWSEIDDEILACLREGPKSTTELGRRLGVSSKSLTSLLLMLAAEGRIRVDSVELAESDPRGGWGEPLAGGPALATLSS